MDEEQENTEEEVSDGVDESSITNPSGLELQLNKKSSKSTM